MFIRFDRMHERTNVTDRQTPHDDIGRACIASRGKNESVYKGGLPEMAHIYHSWPPIVIYNNTILIVVQQADVPQCVVQL